MGILGPSRSYISPGYRVRAFDSIEHENLRASSTMGDLGETSQFWMPPTAPQALPLGKGNIYPFGEPHVSAPTMMRRPYTNLGCDQIRLLAFLYQHGTL